MFVGFTDMFLPALVGADRKRADSICRRYGLRVSAHLYVGSRCTDYQVENTFGVCPHWRHLPDSDGDFPPAGCPDRSCAFLV